MILLLLSYLLMPAAVIWLCRHVAVLDKIGPILILYAIGIVIGNLPFLPANAPALQEALSSAIIPLAIPMLLFNSDFAGFPVRRSLLTLFCGLVAVVVTVVVGQFLFGGALGEQAPKIGGMLTGVYTGGTPNLAALKLMLGVPGETYVLINSYDMIVSFVYLVFLMSVGIRFFRRILPRTGITASAGRGDVNQELDDPYSGIFRPKSIVQILKAFGLSAAILGVSLLAARAFDQSYFMVVVILTLTTLGIAASFIRPVRRLKRSYYAGMYLVYIFSMVVASMANLSHLDFRGGIYLFVYIAFVVFGSLIVQTLLSKAMRIDADSMTICSVALINSPPMVPMIAAAMKNRDAVAVGLGIGIIGYAVGNYLGLLIYELLRTL